MILDTLKRVSNTLKTKFKLFSLLLDDTTLAIIGVIKDIRQAEMCCLALVVRRYTFQ
jgi:hypothetical protein